MDIWRMGNLKTGGIGQKTHDYPFWDNVGEIRRAFSKKTSTWAYLGDLGLFQSGFGLFQSGFGGPSGQVISINLFISLVVSPWV